MADSTTINFTPKNSLDSEGAAFAGVPTLYEAFIDASLVNLAAASYALFDVPEGHLHLGTTLEVVTAEGGAATVDIGITGGDVDCLLDGADVNGTAGTFTSSVAAAHGIGGTTGGYVTPNGGVTFSLLCNDALDAAKFRVTSLFMPIKGTLTSATDSSV